MVEESSGNGRNDLDVPFAVLGLLCYYRDPLNELDAASR